MRWPETEGLAGEGPNSCQAPELARLMSCGEVSMQRRDELIDMVAVVAIV